MDPPVQPQLKESEKVITEFRTKLDIWLPSNLPQSDGRWLDELLVELCRIATVLTSWAEFLNNPGTKLDPQTSRDAANFVAMVESALRETNRRLIYYSGKEAISLINNIKSAISNNWSPQIKGLHSTYSNWLDGDTAAALPEGVKTFEECRFVVAEHIIQLADDLSTAIPRAKMKTGQLTSSA